MQRRRSGGHAHQTPSQDVSGASPRSSAAIICAAACWLAANFYGLASTYYVDAARPDDTGSGTDWSAAKKTIQAAVNLAADGDTVLVADGVYSNGTTITPGYTLKNRVVIVNAITVRSVNGPGVTVIEGSGTNWFNTSTAVRCVYMRRGVLDGFTLQGGTTFGTGLGSSDNLERRGGGVNMSNAEPDTFVFNCVINSCLAYDGGGASYGTLARCVLVGNSADGSGGGSCYSTMDYCVLSNNLAKGQGGGAYYGSLNGCTISGCYAKSYGGGSSHCTLSDCRLKNNSASGGGGSYYGTLTGCMLSENMTRTANGGGSCYGTLNNCSLIDNTAYEGGGGAYGCILNNCAIIGNKAKGLSLLAGSGYGGGSKGCTLNNCMLVNNWAKFCGGGSSDDTLKNCTIKGNSADRKGGGVYLGTLYNSIVVGNYRAEANEDNFTNTTFSYSCSYPQPAGPGNICADPLFISGNDLRLEGGSPCIDVGDNGYVTLATDLAGIPRILNQKVDMGAYEYAFVDAPVPVPYAWMDQYPTLLSLAGANYKAAAMADADGDGHAAWQEYVAGPEPTNSESVLRALIAISNGAPRLAWSPDLGTVRVYTVTGKTNVADTCWGPANAGCRFFRVGVSMP